MAQTASLVSSLNISITISSFAVSVEEMPSMISHSKVVSIVHNLRLILMVRYVQLALTIPYGIILSEIVWLVQEDKYWSMEPATAQPVLSGTQLTV